MVGQDLPQGNVLVLRVANLPIIVSQSAIQMNSLFFLQFDKGGGSGQYLGYGGQVLQVLIINPVLFLIGMVAKRLTVNHGTFFGYEYLTTRRISIANAIMG